MSERYRRPRHDLSLHIALANIIAISLFILNHILSRITCSFEIVLPDLSLETKSSTEWHLTRFITMKNFCCSISQIASWCNLMAWKERTKAFTMGNLLSLSMHMLLLRGYRSLLWVGEGQLCRLVLSFLVCFSVLESSLSLRPGWSWFRVGREIQYRRAKMGTLAPLRSKSLPWSTHRAVTYPRYRLGDWQSSQRYPVWCPGLILKWSVANS